MAPRQRVAIVGMGGIFPQSATIDQFWANVKNGINTAREVPLGRWILAPDDAYDPQPGTPDRAYSLRGCFIEGFQLDPAGLALDRDLLAQLDPMCHLALHAGRQAWQDAVTKHLDPRRVGVILGNIALPTDSASAWTRDILGREIAERIGVPHIANSMHPLNCSVAGLPAGLLAKALGLGGGAFALDAACASSLYALKLAVDELLAGRADAMLTGGVSRPDCLYTQMGFSQLRALSPSGRCSPFDAKADGLVVGEGSGVFVLKRLDDALKAGDRIYATIAGIGLSNDVHGRLLAPSTEGQLRAMHAAYAQAGWSPQDIDLIECHGTGTPVGDGVEFASLVELWQHGDWRAGQCVIGSVKSNIGHALTAAGSAGLLKVLLSIRHETLPATANFASPEPHLVYDESPFRVLASSQPWQRRAGAPSRRAAVSAFGFGGINAHVLLEEWDPSAGRATIVGTVPGPTPTPLVAIVGMDTHFGPWESLEAFRDRVLGDDDVSQAGFAIDELVVPADRFRIPPKELEEMLPQQLLMLKVAAGAIDDAKFDREALLRTGVFIGIELDPNTTNFNLRWSLLNNAREWNDQLGLNLSPEALSAWTQELRDGVHPPLTANRTMGALGGIVASRIAREFHVGGPSFTISSEECSGLDALQVAVRRLQQGELDQAIVGAVDLAGIRRAANGEGAAAVILKRLDDAVRAGDRVYAVVRGVGVSEGCPSLALRLGHADIGDAGVATGLADVVKTCLCLHHERLPVPPQYWLRNRADGPRQAEVSSTNAMGSHAHVLLEENTGPRTASLKSLRTRTEALFALEADDPAGLRQQIQKLREHAMVAPNADIDTLARSWWQAQPNDPHQSFGLGVVAESPADLVRQLDTLPAIAPHPLPPLPRLAFVFPGSGNHYLGMGRELSTAFPGVLCRQDAETGYLRDQLLPNVFWTGDSLANIDNRTTILGQVAFGSIVSDVVRSLGVEPHASIGYSLGESSANFALRAWTERDEMLRRLMASPLFVSDLAGECNAARRAWGLKPSEAVDWIAGIVPCPAEQVRQALVGRERVYLLIVNTRSETVIGGAKFAVERLVRDLSTAFLPLSGVSTVHCEIARQVEEAYRTLHLLHTTPPAGIRFYSGASSRVHELTRESAAESIVAQALHPIDFPAMIEQAYHDGIRVFVEIGPGSSCTRMIGQILGQRPHLAQSASVAGQSEFLTILRLLASLIAIRVPVELGTLYGHELATTRTISKSERVVRIAVARKPFDIPPPPKVADDHRRHHAPRDGDMNTSEENHHAERDVYGDRGPASMLKQLTAAQAAKAEAHEAYLRFSENLTRTIANHLSTQIGLAASNPEFVFTRPVAESPRPALDREQCLEFAVGSIANVLGHEFADVDTYPTRVRLPDEPLMLVDRIMSITGTPRSMTSGIVVTEHDIHPGAWYLDAERIPTCIAVEAGQADLFLSGYLGIDFETKGLAVYRLLDAVVTFHRGLPGPGAVIHYEIHIDNFFRQGTTPLFRFRFEGTVDGEPLLTMRDGCAGFFTVAELNAGKGIVQTELDRQPRPGVRPDDWEALVPMAVETYDEPQIDALRSGDLVGCFGPAFAHFDISNPLTIPGGAMKLVDRVVHLDPNGGRFGLGLIRAEADIHPDDWFITCHFIDDQVMPGTLMYECCLHTLRIFLLRMGWVVENNGPAFEPIAGVASRLKCRGQVLATTRTVTYEVSLKEIGYRPEPYVLVDALMYADGKAIVEITDMSLQLTGATRESIQAVHHAERDGFDEDAKPAIYDYERILAFAIGNPSDAFGERYRVFDKQRFIARLPGPPYQFLDRITEVNAEPWQMVAGGVIEAQYDVPSDAWYFDVDRQDVMPFAVLLEIALQPCGWLAAYVGSALASPVDLSFRNLGGSAIQFQSIPRDIGILTTTVQITKAAKSGGMIIQDFEFDVKNRGQTVYRGTTNFGFFSKASLAQQVGVRDAKLYEPSDAERARGRSFDYPAEPPFPQRIPQTTRMLDRVDLYVPDGGPHGLGFIVGTKIVDPAEWFFKAHFYLDPVCPGSLGLESFLQLLKVIAVKRWGADSAGQFDVLAELPHRWIYRGQVIPTNKVVTVQAIVTAINDDQRTIVADGFLLVDGLVIYQMNDFTLRMLPQPAPSA